ncbi:MAG: capsular biosynthesis protein, partial [Alphaproteobacteria bacterium]
MMSEVSYEPTGYSSDDLSGVLSRYRRHVPVVVGATLLSVLAAYGITKMMKPVYTADAYVQFQPSQALVGTPTGNGQQAQTTPDQVIDTQAEILRSPSLAKVVVAKLKLNQDPEFNSALADKGKGDAAKPAGDDSVISAVSGNLDASRVGLTSVFKVSFKSRDPAKAATVANAFAENYIQQGLERKTAALTGNSSLVSSQVSELRREADAADSAVQNYKVSRGLVSAGGVTIAEQEVSQLNQQLATARAEEAEANARLAAARRQAASGTGGQDVGAALDSSTIAQLRQRRADASRSVASLTSRYGERFPEVIQARQSLTDLDTQIQGEVSRILSNLEAQAQIQRDRRASIEASVNGARGNLSAGAAATVGLADLQRTADAVKLQYEAVLTKANMTDTQASLVQPDAQITSPAST